MSDTTDTTETTDSGNGGLRDRRISFLAYALADAYDPVLEYDADGNVLIAECWYRDADVLLRCLDGVR